MKPFRWKNCRADVTAWRHGSTVRSFFDDVIVSAIRAVEEKIAALGRSDNPGDAFAQADMRDVLRETKLAFSLSIQSIWERQLRSYLRSCAEELHLGSGLAGRAASDKGEKLRELFHKLRGIRLECFPSFAALETLDLLGNACRHGDGTSAKELAKRCPELWPLRPPMPFGDHALLSEFPPVALMDVPIDRLQAFVVAIVAFWGDVEYIYKESIELKHPRLEAELARERTERSWFPYAASGSDD